PRPRGQGRACSCQPRVLPASAASATRRAKAVVSPARELSIQGCTCWYPAARYSRAWSRHSSRSASLAQRASGVVRSSYSATAPVTVRAAASGSRATWSRVTASLPAVRATYGRAECGRSVVRVSWESCHRPRYAARAGAAPSSAAIRPASCATRRQCSATDSGSRTPTCHHPALRTRLSTPSSWARSATAVASGSVGTWVISSPAGKVSTPVVVPDPTSRHTKDPSHRREPHVRLLRPYRGREVHAGLQGADARHPQGVLRVRPGGLRHGGPRDPAEVPRAHRPRGRSHDAVRSEERR